MSEQERAFGSVTPPAVFPYGDDARYIGLGLGVVLVVVALILAVVNAGVKPIVAFLSLPLYILTLGLFTVVWYFVQTTWVKKIDPRCRGTMTRAASRPIRNPAKQAISQTLK